jgi:pimeloyl-ACP methyl ester carboxylesterase
MRLNVNGTDTFVATGGRDFDPALPAVIFLHGAGFDHTVWALLSRWFAHRGYSVLAPDFPGHGHSGGEPLGSIEAMADWTAALIEVTGAHNARIIGHSMGSLVALETTARYPTKVNAIALICTAATMRVSPDLLHAAESGDHAAIDMVTIWGHSRQAGIGGSLAPGLWMLGGANRLLERSRPGVLYKDLAACAAYDGGLAAAAKVTVPATVVLGERDLMTPAKSGAELARALPNARVVTLVGAGHMLMSERPDEVLDALRDRIAAS